MSFGRSTTLNKFLCGKPIPRAKNGDVGIELEIEGSIIFGDDLTIFWDAKDEPSLRGGYEFVLKRPIPIKDVDEALGHLNKTLSISTLQPTIRCSTHIHVNVSRFTNLEVYQALGYYFLIEDLLVQTQGPLRIGNLFCLRMSDAESVFHDLCYSIEGQGGFSNFSMDSHKYGAVNLAAVRRFGSLEFRFFRPLKTDQIGFWTKLLHQIVNEAKRIPLKRVLDMIENERYLDVLHLTMDSRQIETILSSQSSDWRQHLDVNFESIREISKLLEGPKFFKLSPTQIEIEDDFDPEDDELAGLTVSSMQPSHATAWAAIESIAPDSDFDFDDPD